jgi:threonine dehydratase
VATAIKDGSSRHRIHGFQPEIGGAILKSVQKGERVSIGKVQSIADALVATIPGERTFPLIQKHVDSFGGVSEKEILEAMHLLYEDHKLVIEPGGAVAVAGLIRGEYPLVHDDVICVLTGGNIDLQRLRDLLLG